MFLKIGVTGSTGMLGSLLMRRLGTLGFCEPMAIPRDKLREAQVDICFHLGEPSSVSSQDSWAQEQCFERVKTLCDHPAIERIIYISSASIYDKSAVPVSDEDSPIKLDTTYKRIKFNSERLLLSSSKRATIVRLGTVIDYRPNRSSILADIFEQIDGGSSSIILRNPSDVSAYISAFDLVECLVVLLRSDFEGVFNCASIESVKSSDLLNLVLKTLGLTSGGFTPRSIVSRLEQNCWRLDASKLRSIGWRPNTDLGVAITDGFANFQTRK